MRPALWMALAGVAGLAIGAAWPPPPIPAAKQAPPAWSLPTPAELQRHSKDDFQAARRGIRWVGEGTAGDTAAAGPTAWRLAGIVTTPAPVALVLREGKAAKVERIEAGGTLPDGSRLLEVARGSIVAELDGCRTVYQLHRRAPVTTDACPARSGQGEK
jgi:hypothetical protein